jgi:hypothetical protein
MNGPPRVGFGRHHPRRGEVHAGKRILDDRFQLHPRQIGVGLTEPQDQRPLQQGRNTVEREAEDRCVKAALNARRPDDIDRVLTAEGARQVMQQPRRYFCIVALGHCDYLCSISQAPSQSAGGGLAVNWSMRPSSASDGPSPGKISSAELNAAFASSQRIAR